MLNSYLQRVRLLCNDKIFARFNDGDFVSYTNTARGQIAGEGECIRVYASLAVTANALPTPYPFTSIVFPSGTTGVQGVINVRMVTYPMGNGQLRSTPREWEYFNTYIISKPKPIPAPPTVWTQFGQGVNGTLFFGAIDQSYTLSLDTVCYPSPLGVDSDPEAIPYLWTDAIPYFTAYLAYLNAQDAEKATAMFQLYQGFMSRARQFATSSVLPHQYEQAPDMQMASRLGIQKAG